MTNRRKYLGAVKVYVFDDESYIVVPCGPSWTHIPRCSAIVQRQGAARLPLVEAIQAQAVYKVSAELGES